ncbi:YfcL family protein [uncultured Paraglaciecola sp.]|uniref:YfcL family protein n=1 Tax=uncultured Paraglaciecola sp. TaxID=1765024 RepID=UPI0026153313|nr:YfcL family protein [uncultured Paraglaciecola sp.]
MTLSAPHLLDIFIQNTETYLDQVVEHGNDQELFIASYLQGHFAVAAGQSQVQNMTQVAELSELMQHSLHQAFENKELIDEDQQQVQSLWQTLLAAEK